MSLAPLKRVLRHVVGKMVPAVWRTYSDPRLVILAYHRVLPSGHADRETEQPGMRVLPDTFAMHLDILGRHFEWVDLDQWLLDRTANRRLPLRACAVTFDDGWRDNYEYAFPALRAANVPATLFVATDMVDTDKSFWPNRLGQILSSLPEKVGMRVPTNWPTELKTVVERAMTIANRLTTIDEAICACKQEFSDARMTAWLDELAGNQVARRSLLTWSEIEEMERTGLVRVGSHTRRHVRLLSETPPEIIHEEVASAMQLLSTRFTRASRVFCYPNGDHFDGAVEIVSRYHIGAVTTRKGWNRCGADAYRLRRVSIHDDVADTPARLLATVSGFIA